MNNPIVTPNTYQLGATSAYTVFQPISGGSVSYGQTTPSSSWRRFIKTSTQQQAESTMTAIPATKTTTEGPTVLKPAPLPGDYDERVEEFLHFLDSFESETEAIDDVTSE